MSDFQCKRCNSPGSNPTISDTNLSAGRWSRGGSVDQWSQVASHWWGAGSGFWSASKWEVRSGSAQKWKSRIRVRINVKSCIRILIRLEVKRWPGSASKWSGSVTLVEGGSFTTRTFLRKAWALISRLVASALFMFSERLFSCLKTAVYVPRANSYASSKLCKIYVQYCVHHW